MSKEIRQTWVFTQSPREVWDYLTKPELIEKWLMKTDFQPIVGHKFTFLCNETNYCEVLEVKPFTNLSYTWQANSAVSPTPFTSKVAWTLVAKGSGTELQLVHNGFTALEDRLGHDKGWVGCGTRFMALLNPVKNDRTLA